MQKILVIGSLNLDIVVNVEHMPEVGETILCSHMDMIPGGKGANQACAAAKLGAETTILGVVGKDMYADKQLESLREAGVDITRILKRDKISTGLALITVNAEGDNSIVVISGANETVSKDYINQNIDIIEKSDIVILQLEIPIDTVVYAAKKAKELGKIVILDPAPVPKADIKEIYQYVDVIKPNETELGMLVGTEQNDIGKKTEILRKFGIKDVVVTLGGKGVYVNSEEEGILEIPALKVKAIDTTAAGDAFTAALAIMLAKGASVREAVEFANKVSAVVVTRKGAQTSIPSISEVMKIC